MVKNEFIFINRPAIKQILEQMDGELLFIGINFHKRNDIDHKFEVISYPDSAYSEKTSDITIKGNIEFKRNKTTYYKFPELIKTDWSLGYNSVYDYVYEFSETMRLPHFSDRTIEYAIDEQKEIYKRITERMSAWKRNCYGKGHTVPSKYNFRNEIFSEVYFYFQDYDDVSLSLKTKSDKKFERLINIHNKDFKNIFLSYNEEEKVIYGITNNVKKRISLEELPIFLEKAVKSSQSIEEEIAVGIFYF